MSQEMSQESSPGIREPEEIYIKTLKFNYEQLHESMWENHKVSWVVTSIFIPLLFTMQGYFVKEYDDTFKNSFSLAILGVFLIQYLAVAWWLMMQLFRQYNHVRRDRLKLIETELFKLYEKKGICTYMYPVEQYRLHYGVFQVGLHHGGFKIDLIKISFNRIYTLILFESVFFSIFFIYLEISYLLDP